MLQMSKHYEPEFKKIVHLHLEEGRTLKSLANESGVSHASISNQTARFSTECQTNEEAQADYDFMKENLQLKKQLARLQKENDFLKKRRHSLRRKSIRGLLIYTKIQQRVWTMMASQEV